MNKLSQRAQNINQEKESLLKIGFEKCLSSPYHPIENPRGIINLGTSENLICSDLLIPKLESITKITAPELQYFPINGVPDFRREVGRFLGEKTRSDVELAIENISIMNGCSSVFNFLAYVIGDEGDYFLCPSPSYGMVANYMSGFMGLNIIHTDLNDKDNMVSVENLQKDYDAATAEGKKVTGLVIINPHNPTGALYNKELVLEVMGFAKDVGIHLLIDEIYFLSMFEEDTFQSCLSYSTEWPDPERTHFLWSFSKDFAMSGMRCAVLYSKNTAIHSTFNRMCFYHSVPAIVQMKLCALLRDRQWVDTFLSESRHRLREHAGIVMDYLDKLGISYVEPQGTLYLWANFETVFKRGGVSASEADHIFLLMLDNLIYIPSSRGFDGVNPKYFRIVYAIPKDYLIEAMERLTTFVHSYKSD